MKYDWIYIITGCVFGGMILATGLLFDEPGSIICGAWIVICAALLAILRN